MEETVQVLFDEGALTRDGGGQDSRKPLSELKIPPTVQASRARIDRLPPKPRICCRRWRCSDVNFRFT